MKKLSVIIVSYNVCYLLEQALRSVRAAVAHLAAPAEIFVVDNHSTDDSVAMVQQRFPEVTLLVNEHNLGFAKANNQALRRATGEYVLLLNPDTLLEADALLKCCQFMAAHPAAGGLGGKITDEAGNFRPESKRGLPTPAVSFYKLSGLAHLFPQSAKFARYYLGHLSRNQTHEVEVLAGAFMFLRRSVLPETGLLDEAFFMYGEDIDLSYRIQQAGYKNYYYPGVKIIHYKGQSTRHNRLRYGYEFYKAMLLFHRKHFAGQMANVSSFFIQLAIVLRAIAAGPAWVVAKILPFLDDAAIIGAGLYGLKTVYEKQIGSLLPLAYTVQLILVAIGGWLAAIYLSGGYQQPFRPERLVRGGVWGLIFLAAFAHFRLVGPFPNFILLWGSVWTLAALVGKRLLYHYGQYQDFRLGDRPRPRLAVVGSEPESKRAVRLLKQAGVRAKVIGFISPEYVPDPTAGYLGELRQLRDITRVHRLNELVFCEQDLSVTQVLTGLAVAKEQSTRSKLLPAGRDYIISTNKPAIANPYHVPVKLAR